MKGINIVWRVIKLAFISSQCVAFLNGILLASIFYFFVESQYENELFSKISSSIIHECAACKSNDELFFVKTMETTYGMQFSRKIVFKNEQFSSIKYEYLRSADSHLMDALGACGSFSTVLARTLQVSGYKVRIAQMEVNGIYGGHMVVDVRKKNGDWVVLDPLFNLAFKDKNGKLVGIEDVKNNWNYFKAQIPVGYNNDYRYEDARFTNWDKFGFFSRAIKKILDLFMGKQVATNISIRPIFLNLYQACLIALIIVYIPLFLYTIKRLYTFMIYRGKQLIPEKKKIAVW